MNKSAKITNKSISAFHSSNTLRSELWDIELKGFYAIRLGTCTSYRFKYRNEEGKQRTITLGKYPALSAQEARMIAKKAIGEISNGIDVLAIRSANREIAASSKFKKLGAFLDGPYAEYQKRKKSGTSTLAILNKHFEPWRKSDIHQLTPTDVRHWQSKKETEGLQFATLQRTFGALKTCLNHAVKLDIIEQNPLSKVQLDKPYMRELELLSSSQNRRYLSDDEIKALFAGIAAYQSEKRQMRLRSIQHGKKHLPDLSEVQYVDHVAPWLLTMFYTGFRPGDLNGLRWEHICLQTGRITKVIEKTAHQASSPMHFPISSQLQKVLKVWHFENAEPVTGYVFPSLRTGGRLTKGALQKPWKAIKKVSNLPDELDLYTLRHNFASQLILSGADLLTVSKLMGHTNIQTTIAHYGHLNPDRSKAYVDALGEQFSQPT
ncbi:tyrosine-type recombinase/integrase [Neptuniibacter sp. QD48_55]|uniref:tyrosine-type recombinase/integrase n=1 Tax=Neptuniibacter sp. QD48_55 TaxID=3398212 RepID=UPI0039F44950